MKRVGLASLSLLGSLSLAPSLHAQPAAPTPAPAADAPAPTAAAPAPAAAAPIAAPAAAASASADVKVGDSYAVGADAEPPASGDDNEVERTWRATSLHLGSALNGSTGLLHVSEAGAGAPGTFRFAVTGSYFAGSGFLCNSTSRCPSFNGESTAADDDVTRAGAHVALSATGAALFGSVRWLSQPRHERQPRPSAAAAGPGRHEYRLERLHAAHAGRHLLLRWRSGPVATERHRRRGLGQREHELCAACAGHARSEQPLARGRSHPAALSRQTSATSSTTPARS